MTLLSVSAVVLAGGQSRRMDGVDKGLILLQGVTLYQRVIGRLHHQVKTVFINTNRNIENYKMSGYPVITDTLPGYLGPLAGVLAGLNNATTEWVVFVPCDTPFIPPDLVSQLWKHKKENSAVYVKTERFEHPTLLLIKRDLKEHLQLFLQNDHRKMTDFLHSIGAEAVEFFCDEDCFMNINSASDLEIANQKIDTFK